MCLHCHTIMQAVSKTGILIDLCPSCKGTWLDRGELEKILDRVREIERDWEEERRPRYQERDDYDERRYGEERRYRKKRSWTEIFDIFD